MGVKRIKFSNLNGFGREFTSAPESEAARKIVNLKSEGECLVDGLQLSLAYIEGRAITLPEEVKDGLFYADTQAGERLLFAGGGVIYELDPFSPSAVFSDAGMSYSGKPCFANVLYNGIKYAAIVDGNGEYYLYDGNTVVSRAMESGVIKIMQFFGRMVMVTDRRIYVSAEGSLIDFDVNNGAVRIDMDGDMRIRNVVAFGNEMIIACDKSLCRIARSEFGGTLGLRTLFSDAERLIPETLTSRGDGAYVLTDRGLAFYNGANVTFTFSEVKHYATDGVCGFMFGGEYVACVKDPETDNKTAVLSFGEKCGLSDNPIVAATTSSDGKRVFALSGANGYLCELGGKGAPPHRKKQFVTPLTDFGVYGVKTLTEFSLCSSADIKVIIEADGKKRCFRLNGGKGRRILRPNVSGQVFQIALTAEGSGIKLYSIQAEIEY